jgi:hypothetical protein
MSVAIVSSAQRSESVHSSFHFREWQEEEAAEEEV